MIIKRFCRYCKSKEPSEKYRSNDKNKEKMEISYDNIEDFIYYDGAMYHKACFMKDRPRVYKHMAENKSGNISEESYAHIKHALNTEELYNFMLDNYSLTVIDRRVFQKLQSIYNGTFGGMTTGIPITDLLDMWKKKIEYLNKVHSQNASKGKMIDGSGRILYDLSILINKYDSYLRWKRKQEILQANTNCQYLGNGNQSIDFSIFEKQGAAKNENTLIEDINSLLDEMF